MQRFAIAIKQSFRSDGKPDWPNLFEGIKDIHLVTRAPGYRVVVDATESAMRVFQQRNGHRFTVETVVGYNIET